jgi:hypothetical protein
MRYSVEEAMISLCMDKHGDTEIHWTGVAENFNSLDNVKRNDDKKLGFTWDEVLDRQKVLDKEFLDKKYQRDREPEYPSIADQLDEIYHNGINAWKAVIKKTKDKYPKG